MSEHGIILLVEDRPDDVLLIRKAFERAKVSNPIYVVSDGEEAVEYLSGSGKFWSRAEYPLPELVLLDLKLPKMDGFDVLQWIRSHPGLQGLAVVVLTSSEEPKDINLAYGMGANSFLLKPTDFLNYVTLGKTVADFWMKTVRIPQSFRSRG